MYNKNSHDLVWPWPTETHPSLWFLWLKISLIIGYNTINMIFPDIYFRHWQFCTFDRTVTSLHWQAKKYPRLAKKMLHVTFKKACLLAKFGYPYYLWGLRTHKRWFSTFFQSYVNLPLLMIVSHVKLTDPSKEILPSNKMM